MGGRDKGVEGGIEGDRGWWKREQGKEAVRKVSHRTVREKDTLKLLQSVPYTRRISSGGPPSQCGAHPAKTA
jgi:hypothetical protein